MSSCANESSNSCLNDGYCVSDQCICASACFIGNNCEINYNALSLPLTGAMIQDIPSSRNFYIVIFVLLVFIGLINNYLALTTFIQESIRITPCGVYLITFSICSVMLMLLVLTYVLTIIKYNNDSYRSWACFGIPYMVNVMLDTSILITVAIAIERVLIECFDFSIYGSRIRALITFIGLLIFGSVSNLDEIFARHITYDHRGDLICTYDFPSHPDWRRVDTVFSYTHVIIPCVFHLVCVVCILTVIARRKIFIHNAQQHPMHVWLQQLYLHRDFLIPVLCIIICVLPHGIFGHLLTTCIPYSATNQLRLHIALILFMYVPQILIFVIYVYPSGLYMKEFRHTIVYKTLCCYFYRRRLEMRRRKKTSDLLYRRRTPSVATTNTNILNNDETEETTL